MKYIDAEKLVAKIEGRIEEYNASIEENYNNIKAGIDAWRWAECKWFLSLIDSLQQDQPDFADTSKMEQPSVEDAMKALDEKIALVKENGTWDGVDVDKYMDEVRGREPEVDIDEEIDKFMFAPFQNFKRVSRHCLVDMGDGKEWVPVYDWKITTYKRADAHFLRKFARHFYELGLKAGK